MFLWSPIECPPNVAAGEICLMQESYDGMRRSAAAAGGTRETAKIVLHVRARERHQHHGTGGALSRHKLSCFVKSGWAACHAEALPRNYNLLLSLCIVRRVAVAF